MTVCGQGYQINEQLNKYYLYKNEVEEVKHKSVMRFSPCHYQEDHLLFIQGGAYKVYGKQKLTLSSVLMINLSSL